MDSFGRAFGPRSGAGRATGRVAPVSKCQARPTPVAAVDAVRALEPYCGEFLYTHVDAEGLMGGTNIPAILAVKAATMRRLTAAGGITTQDEVDTLEQSGVDAVVGMAVYTCKLQIPSNP